MASEQEPKRTSIFDGVRSISYLGYVDIRPTPEQREESLRAGENLAANGLRESIRKTINPQKKNA